jgi:hypothetical protein
MAGKQPGLSGGEIRNRPQGSLPDLVSLKSELQRRGRRRFLSAALNTKQNAYGPNKKS